MTTDEWEALLAGTTPAPWRWYWDYGIIALEGADTMPVATDLHVHDSDLLAAAPTSVAEVVRLRRAITDLRDAYAAPDDPGDDYGRGMEAAYQIAARDLTRILEGDNDE